MNKIEVFNAVRKYFPENEYALMGEVRNGAGFNADRSADWMALNLWPSRGLALHGIEQKSFRSDWIKELKTPAKADAFFGFCDYWWLLTTADNVAKIEEIPDQWGWMHIHNGKIKIMKAAPKLEALPLDRGILASMLKRACSKEGYIPANSIQSKIDEAKKIVENAREYKYDQLKEKYDNLISNVTEFQSHTGILLTQDRWRKPDFQKIGNAVKAITEGGVDKFIQDLQNLQSRSDQISESIKNTLAFLPVTTEGGE